MRFCRSLFPAGWHPCPEKSGLPAPRVALRPPGPRGPTVKRSLPRACGPVRAASGRPRASRRLPRGHWSRPALRRRGSPGRLGLASRWERRRPWRPPRQAARLRLPSLRCGNWLPQAGR